MSSGQIRFAEEQFDRVINYGEKYPDDYDIQQTHAWTLIVKGHLFFGKSLYEQAIEVLKEAEGICSKIDNYAGIAQANAVVAQVYGNTGDKKRADECKEKSAKFQEIAKEMKR